MIYIVLVNWNGWRDTLECLESLFKLNERNFTVLVCDNFSSDDSVDRIMAWADGSMMAEAADARYAGRLNHFVPKPLARTLWRPGEEIVKPGSSRLVLIPLGKNLGFAGGCNVGMRFALAQKDAEFIWLLNNDTVVEEDALTHLVAKMRDEPKIGLCGSTLRFYFQPDVVQCYGGYRFNEWIGRVLPLNNIEGETGNPSEMLIERSLSYVSGASTLVRRDFLETVGVMNEQYFLYFEEIDWAVRSRGQYSLGYCMESVVYHKEGGSIGSSHSAQKRSSLSESYLSRNRVLFTWNYFPGRLPILMVWVTLVSFLRMLQGNFRVGQTMLCSAWGGLVQSLMGQTRSN